MISASGAALSRRSSFACLHVNWLCILRDFGLARRANGIVCAAHKIKTPSRFISARKTKPRARGRAINLNFFCAEFCVRRIALDGIWRKPRGRQAQTRRASCASLDFSARGAADRERAGHLFARASLSGRADRNLHSADGQLMNSAARAHSSFAFWSGSPAKPSRARRPVRAAGGGQVERKRLDSRNGHNGAHFGSLN